ncbi:unnamed protein product [Ambrosiozyma monospora]|uniref:Unnamed protein product n=1 Tax=Ambrosiozyma monospora TaxID=43982 RepID=A0ACB5UBV8_AMBMO|nr:unnamed protein product [Ambrosiozyma monospora]
MEFDDEPRDECSKVPANYKPSEFSTDALQHSKVKLSWDETPAERLKIQSRAFSQKEIEDMDFKAYLASDSDDSENEEELRNKYKNLASSVGKVGDKDIFGLEAGDNDDSEGDIDMEITFTPGLSEKKETNANNDKEEKSTITTFKEKEKERRRKRKERVKELKREQDKAKRESKHNNKKLKDKKKKGEITEEEKKSQKQLESIMKDEIAKDAEHFSMKEIMKAEKQKKKAKKDKKHKKHNVEDVKIDTDIKIAENDDRFKEMFEDHRESSQIRKYQKEQEKTS